MKRDVRINNGYRMIYLPDHPRAQKDKNHLGYVYEHIVVAEEYLGRSLNENEVVHHLDMNRKNNRRENLLILDRDQHGRLHAWIDIGYPMEGQTDAPSTPIVPMFCEVCGRCVQEKATRFCSVICNAEINRKVDRPTKEQLKEDIDKMPFIQIGKKYGVSDNAVRKWAKAYGIKWKGAKGREY